MARYIPDDIVEEIRSRGDIIDLIQSYMPVKRAGGRYRALCPFHNEKTPSFFINPDLQTYHCFGCGKGGDIFRFVMDRENMDFYDAAVMLADRFGVNIRLADDKSHGGAGLAKSAKDRIYKLHEKIAAWFHEFLVKNPGSPVGEYLARRGVPAEVLENFKLGASPDSWDSAINYCGACGFTREEILSSGIVVRNEESGKIYDRFRNRLIFPIWDDQGRICGFSARTVEENQKEAKYVNSPETPVFKKNRLLYGLNFARDSIKDKKAAILCEGQFDVIAMHRAGFTNAVAPQGTAFTEEQARIISRYCSTVYLALDSDEAGVKASLRDMEILMPLNFQIFVISFQKGDDPDSLFAREGTEGISRSYQSAEDFFDFLLRYNLKSFNPSIPFEQSKIVENMLAVISMIENSVVRANYASRLASSLRIPESGIFTELNKLLRKKNRSANESDAGNEEARTARFASFSDPASKVEETLLMLAIRHGTAAKRLADELPPGSISKTPVGHALEEVISMALNGEWEHAPKKLAAMLSETPDPDLSRILTEETNVINDDELAARALSECLVKIKESRLRRSAEELLAQWKNAQNSEEQEKYREEYLQKSMELKEIISKKSQRSKT